jgi:hypothetical protein
MCDENHELRVEAGVEALLEAERIRQRDLHKLTTSLTFQRNVE